ncbi:MAG: hypothetical protein AAB358_01680 [Patescibacteria group bacterium]
MTKKNLKISLLVSVVAVAAGLVSGCTIGQPAANYNGQVAPGPVGVITGNENINDANANTNEEINLNKEINDLDQSINSINASDFSDTDLSDKNLGL